MQLSPPTDRLIGIDTSGGDVRGDFSRGSILLFSGAAKYPALVENLQYYILPCFLHALQLLREDLRDLLARHLEGGRRCRDRRVPRRLR